MAHGLALGVAVALDMHCTCGSNALKLYSASRIFQIACVSFDLYVTMSTLQRKGASALQGITAYGPGLHHFSASALQRKGAGYFRRFTLRRLNPLCSGGVRSFMGNFRTCLHDRARVCTFGASARSLSKLRASLLNLLL